MAVKKFSSSEAKEELVKLIGQGKSVKDALLIVDKSLKTYEYYRKTDKDFADKVDRERLFIARGKGLVERVDVPDFPEFCERYLKNKLFDHQLQWFDLLEGREPRGLHASMVYEPGRQSRVIVNTPPHHAKSTTITVNYVVWRIVKDPNVKIVIVSKAQRLAEQFLLQIKERLTSPEYEDLQRDFAPPGGWKDGSASWKATQFYVGGRSSEAKDPTVQALGIRGQLYGSRADLVVIDDAVDNTNVNEYDKQIDWILGIVGSRLTPRTGRLLVIGTRIAAKDLYSELRDPARYYGGSQPWTVLQQPAVLEFAEEPKDWVTLWPYSDLPSDPDQEPEENGLFAKWDGSTLSQERDGITPSQWSRIWMQEQLAEDSVFKSDTIINACGMRAPGFIPEDGVIGRPEGMDGLRLIAGVDPATVGFSAFVLLGVDMRSTHRWVIDIHNEAGMSPDKIKNKIIQWQDKYGVNEWRIERNAFQAFLTRDPEINEYIAARGGILTEHTTTGSNKHDPSFGVMAMATLFENNLIHLPSSSYQNVKSLIEQLVVWQPNPPKGLKTDIVMALWFAEIRAQELVSRVERNGSYRDSMYFTRGGKSSRYFMNDIDDIYVSAAPKTWWG